MVRVRREPYKKPHIGVTTSGEVQTEEIGTLRLSSGNIISAKDTFVILYASGVRLVRRYRYMQQYTVQLSRHEPTVNDSPHPQASLILGFLKANLELG